MIKIKASAVFNLSAIESRMRRAVAQSLGHAGGILTKAMKRTLSVPGNGDPSRPGSPPHKQSGILQRSIRYDKESDTNVVVGSQKRWSRQEGWYGGLHEHGAVTRRKVVTKTSIGDTLILPGGGGRNKRGGRYKITDRKIISEKQRKMVHAVKHQIIRGRSKNQRLQNLVMKDKTVTLPARPFARPTLMENLHRIPYSFRDSL